MDNGQIIDMEDEVVKYRISSPSFIVQSYGLT